MPKFEFIKTFEMNITQNSESIQINISKNIDKVLVQRIIDYIKYLEIVSKSTNSQIEADQLADELNENWWKRNKEKFIK